MAQKVLIMGESGTGKSTSLRNCDPATTAVINPVGKPLPFKNHFEMLNNETDARKMIKAVDEARDHYHMHYAGFLPNDQRFKDIMIDSSMLGTEGTADYLVDAVKMKFGFK